MATIPEQVGKYKILNHLGSGGTSIVYLGMHPTLKRKVVLKKLNLRGKKTFYDRFLQEAGLMMDLNHDHIVRVYDHFKEGSRHYMVMEFVEGLSLDHIIEQSGPLNHETIKYILRCCCKALDYIHSRNIIHRDIKPSNIFISSNGDVKLGDFGIALQENPSGRESSNEGALIGTPSYMAPEQFSPKGRVSARTDLYALGVSYFELLTGKKMFVGESLDELRNAVRRGRHLSLLFLIHNYGLKSWRFIQRSTSRFPVFRYPSAHRALKVLGSFRMNDENSIQDLSDRINSLTQKKGPKSRQAETGRNPGFSQVLGAPPSVKRRPGPLVLMVVALILIGSLFYSGAFYEWFLPHRYGKLSLILNGGFSENTFSPQYMKVFLQYDNTENSWATLQTKGGNRDYILKSGFYRMKTSWGNRVENHSFYLPPLSSGSKPYTVVLQSPKIRPQELDLNLVISDVLTGSLLPLDNRVFLKRTEGTWIPLQSNTKLFAGNAYEIAVKIPGYFETLYTIAPEFYQDEVLLEAALIPLPGELEIHHNLDKLILRIDNQKKMMGGDRQREVQRFGRLDDEPPSWQIPPGDHLLNWSGNGWEQEQRLTVRSGERVVYRVVMDAEGIPQFSIDRKALENP